ncbi:MAG: GH116 family glycosyl hydrolase [Anaerolineae bacterium]|nr:GH116 family glycosyl hydrolase [Anaerolineae bacterium]
MPQPAFPRQDGALVVEHPDKDSLFDMGNLYLFATFDGNGSCTRLLHVEGSYLGTWQLQIAVDGQPVQFEQARAIGRLWELMARVGDTSITLTSALAGNEALAVQLCRVDNRSNICRNLTVDVVLQLNPSIPLRQQFKDQLARSLPKLLRKEQLWGLGWAKSLLPALPREANIIDNQTIEILGRTHASVWFTTHVPQCIKREGRTLKLCFQFEIEPNEALEVGWSLLDKSASMTVDHDLPSKVIEEAHNFAKWLSEQFNDGDPLRRSLFVACLNTSLSMYKIFPKNFSGLLAGPEYAYPPRLYFRDGYWTAQMLLRFRPEWVREHILSISLGVREDGQCPSGVFAPHLGLSSCGNFDWLPDHIDSPALFVLLIRDYIHATGDYDILSCKTFSSSNQNRTLWQAARAALHYLIKQDKNGDGLIEKQHAPNDWADNVRRSSWVTYDQALYVAALKAGAELARARKHTEEAEHFLSKADRALKALNTALWLPHKSHFANYRRADFIEDHYSIDTLIVPFFGLSDQRQTRSLLLASKRLQTRYNSDQPFGDWGVMSVFPPYRNQKDLFGKSAQPFHYHNGADWPYLDGVYGSVLKRVGDPDWLYVITRWWEYSLSKGWLSPVEYFSPAFPPGGMLQGWSSMPALALIENT